MATMTRPVKRLYDIEIDEISLVDRPANQHGVVAIAKNHSEEEHMTVFAADGTPVDEETLEHGDVVYDTDGNEYVFVEEDEDDTSAELQSGHDYEEELVGKSATGVLPGMAGRAQRAGAHVLNNQGKYAAGGGATLFGGGYAAGRRRRGGVEKGMGESVYEALSKSLGQDDRDQVIAKMADEVEVYKAQAEYAAAIAEELQEERELAEYTEIAKSYNLPGDPADLGLVLKNAAATLPDDQLAYLDSILTAAGMASFDEVGTNGGFQASNVLDQVEALAYETVGKADVSLEQATVALFDANPAAYDEYLSEQGR